jgi:hypothetical protein
MNPRRGAAATGFPTTSISLMARPTGGLLHVAAFRGRGIYSYVCGIRLKCLREKGFHSCRDAVQVGKRRLNERTGRWNPTPRGMGRLVRFLWWSSWRESEVGALA